MSRGSKFPTRKNSSGIVINRDRTVRKRYEIIVTRRESAGIRREIAISRRESA
jgi:hypothetical protein